MRNAEVSQARLAETVQSVDCQKLVKGHFLPATASVIIEKELSIFANGEHLVTASITPGMEREYVTGYLFGQGFVNSISELESVIIDGSAARVTFKDARKISPENKKTLYRIVSGGGRVAFFDEMSLSRIQSGLKTGKKEIFQAVNTILEKADIYRETEGVHTTGLFTPEAAPICLVEDIGRHNSLDKVIGYALISEIDRSNTFLASTGRMSSEMVAKICRAGIPVVATKTAVTGTAVAMGRRCGLTIIGFVRDKGTRINTDMDIRTIIKAGMKIYTGTQRITV